MAAYYVFMTHVICRLTAKNRDQLRNPTLGNQVWATFLPMAVARSFSGSIAVCCASDFVDDVMFAHND